MLVVTIPGSEQFNPVTNEFITTKTQTITLEHSLLSISKWESKWHKPYLNSKEKILEEVIDYIRCMTVSNGVDPNVYTGLSEQNIKDILAYIEDPMTATTFSDKASRPSREIITSEVIYYWMTALNIPFDPCQKWHLNRLLTLIQVCSIKSQPSKKMSKTDVMKRNAALNAARKAKYGTTG